MNQAVRINLLAAAPATQASSSALPFATAVGLFSGLAFINLGGAWSFLIFAVSAVVALVGFHVVCGWVAKRAAGAATNNADQFVVEEVTAPREAELETLSSSALAEEVVDPIGKAVPSELLRSELLRSIVTLPYGQFEIVVLGSRKMLTLSKMAVEVDQFPKPVGNFPSRLVRGVHFKQKGFRKTMHSPTRRGDGGFKYSGTRPTPPITGTLRIEVKGLDPGWRRQEAEASDPAAAI